MLQRMRSGHLAKRHLGPALEQPPDLSGKRILVDKETVEQRVSGNIAGIGQFDGCLDDWPHRRAVQRPVHDQANVRRQIVELHEGPLWWRRPHQQRPPLDLAEDFHDAAVFQPGLVVEEPPQFRRQPRDGALRHLARRQPIIVDAQEPPVGAEFPDRRQSEHPADQLGQFALAVRRHQEIPEGAKTLALVAVGDDVTIAQNIVQQRPFAALPGGDALARRPVKVAKILLDHPEIGQQGASAIGYLQKALAHPRRIDQRQGAAAADGLDFAVDLGAPPLQLGNARGRIGISAAGQLAQQLEQHDEARLRASERPPAETGEPV